MASQTFGGPGVIIPIPTPSQ